MGDYTSRTFDEAELLALGPHELEEAEFYDCVFRRVDFSKVPWRAPRVVGGRFEACNLSNVDLRNAVFRGTIFEGTKAVGVNWCELRAFEKPVFRDCVLDYGVFQDLRLEAFVGTDSSLLEADFAGAKLAKADFSRSRLNGALFRGADLREANLLGAEGYAIDPTATKVRGLRCRFPEALSLLAALGIRVEP